MMGFLEAQKISMRKCVFLTIMRGVGCVYESCKESEKSCVLPSGTGAYSDTTRNNTLFRLPHTQPILSGLPLIRQTGAISRIHGTGASHLLAHKHILTPQETMGLRHNDQFPTNVIKNSGRHE